MKNTITTLLFFLLITFRKSVKNLTEHEKIKQ